MADKAIDALTEATALGTGDLFVTQQNAQAKKVTWTTLIGYLAAALRGHGGINSITLTGTNNLVDTYTITYADETTGTFTVTNGRGISGIAKTGTSGLVDAYTITYNDGTTSAFDVTNGNGISSIVWTTSGTAGDGQEHIGTITYTDGTTGTVTLLDGYKGDTGDTSYTHIRYADNEPTSDSDISTSPSDWVGFYSGFSETAPTTYTSYTWYKIKGETGETGNGILSIVKTETSGVVDTYTITQTNGTTSTFTVTNGSSIANIELGSTSGLIDTYIITLTDGSTTSFSVTNAKSIVNVEMVSGSHAAGTSDTYRITFNDNDTFDFYVYNGTNGTGSVSTVSGIQPVNGDVPQIVTGNSAPTTSTVGIANQLYVNLSDGAIYICTGENGGSYDWLSVGQVTVDSAFSTTSNNPVSNAVITGKVGTATLNTASTNLSGAVNELLTNQGSLSGLNTPSTNSLVSAINSVYTVLTALSFNDDDISLTDNSSRTLSEFISATATNLDDAAYTGFYTYSSTAANKPGNNGGVVLAVRQGTNYIHQLAFMNYAAVTQQDVVYYRRYYSGSWTGWVQIAGASRGVSAPNAGNFTPTTYDRVTVYKRFGMGLFRFNINPAGTLTSNTDTVICNISSGCVPVVPMYYTMTDQSGGPYIVTIETNGDVTFNPRGHTGTAFIRGCLAFPT